MRVFGHTHRTIPDFLGQFFGTQGGLQNTSVSFTGEFPKISVLHTSRTPDEVVLVATLLQFPNVFEAKLHFTSQMDTLSKANGFRGVSPFRTSHSCTTAIAQVQYLGCYILVVFCRGVVVEPKSSLPPHLLTLPYKL